MFLCTTWIGRIAELAWPGAAKNLAVANPCLGRGGRQPSSPPAARGGRVHLAEAGSRAVPAGRPVGGARDQRLRDERRAQRRVAASMSATTPLTRAAEGLVPSASRYSPPGPAPITPTPGAESRTELFCSEKKARAAATGDGRHGDHPGERGGVDIGGEAAACSVVACRGDDHDAPADRVADRRAQAARRIRRGAERHVDDRGAVPDGVVDAVADGVGEPLVLVVGLQARLTIVEDDRGRPGPSRPGRRP